MTEMVHGELSFPAGADSGLGAGHDCGAGDEDVDTASRGEEASGELVDAAGIGKVECFDLHPVDTGKGLPRDRGPPRGHEHPCTGRGERSCGFQTHGTHGISVEILLD
jgi:hypothetical protein